ncbi:MAG: hypothetical protein KAJ14_11025, partial [Candidatus Omnitrophica bacterium]|nr:hypothetical protein [Candidatus Omnitrophota bacterium]
RRAINNNINVLDRGEFSIIGREGFQTYEQINIFFDLLLKFRFLNYFYLYSFRKYSLPLLKVMKLKEEDLNELKPLDNDLEDENLFSSTEQKMFNSKYWGLNKLKLYGKLNFESSYLLEEDFYAQGLLINRVDVEDLLKKSMKKAYQKNLLDRNENRNDENVLSVKEGMQSGGDTLREAVSQGFQPILELVSEIIFIYNQRVESVKCFLSEAMERYSTVYAAEITSNTQNMCSVFGTQGVAVNNRMYKFVYSDGGQTEYKERNSEIFGKNDGSRNQKFETDVDFEKAYRQQVMISIEKMLENFLYNGAMRVSSEVKHAYSGFHWIRDSAIVVREIVGLLRLYRKTDVSQLKVQLGERIGKYIEFTKSHWIRDSYIVVRERVGLLRPYRKTDVSQLKVQLGERIGKYIEFTKINQKTNSKFGLGETRFSVESGKAEESDSQWGRPQNDGPALRAMSLMDYVLFLIEQGKIEEALTVYFVIKEDLDYVAEHWQDLCFDLWEDLMGYHFWTRIVQRRALIKGAAFAAVVAALDDNLKVNDTKSWKLAARDLEVEIVKHYDDSKGYILSTLYPDRNKKPNKILDLDSAVIGAIVETVDFEDPFMGVDDPRVIKTVQELEKAFCDLYPINREWIKEGKLGMGIGRYPEDTYDGNGQEGGNPWFVTTGWFAQYYSLLALKLIKLRKIEITSDNISFFRNIGIDIVDSPQTVTEGEELFNKIIEKLSNISQGYLEWKLVHIPEDGSMSEQVKYDTGTLQGPKDLTWSYQSFIRAVDTYEKLSKAMGKSKDREDGGKHNNRDKKDDLNKMNVMNKSAAKLVEEIFVYIFGDKKDERQEVDTFLIRNKQLAETIEGELLKNYSESESRALTVALLKSKEFASIRKNININKNKIEVVTNIVFYYLAQAKKELDELGIKKSRISSNDFKEIIEDEKTREMLVVYLKGIGFIDDNGQIADDVDFNRLVLDSQFNDKKEKILAVLFWTKYSGLHCIKRLVVDGISVEGLKQAGNDDRKIKSILFSRDTFIGMFVYPPYFVNEHVSRRDFKNEKLVEEMISKGILCLDKADTEYVYFAKSIKNIENLVKQLENMNGGLEDKQVVISLWQMSYYKYIKFPLSFSQDKEIESLNDRTTQVISEIYNGEKFEEKQISKVWTKIDKISSAVEDSVKNRSDIPSKILELVVELRKEYSEELINRVSGIRVVKKAVEIIFKKEVSKRIIKSFSQNINVLSLTGDILGDSENLEVIGELVQYFVSEIKKWKAKGLTQDDIETALFKLSVSEAELLEESGMNIENIKVLIKKDR